MPYDGGIGHGIAIFVTRQDGPLVEAESIHVHLFDPEFQAIRNQLINKGMVTFEDSRPDDKLISYDKRIELKNGAMEAAKPQGVPIAIEPAEPLRLECQHFIDCIVRRSEPRTSGEEGLRVLQVLQASQRSMQMNGEPVQVQALANQKVLAL